MQENSLISRNFMLFGLLSLLAVLLFVLDIFFGSL